MKERIAIIVAAALAVAAAGNLAAQTVGSPTINSSGRFTSAADDFIFMTDWQGVDMEKWFGFASWASNAAVLGYAQKFGDLYVALEYNGTLWGNVRTFTSTEHDIDVWGNGDAPKSWKTYTAAPTFDPNDPAPDNNIGVLIGVADMGFRVFFSSTHQGFSDKDFAVGGNNGPYTAYTSYTTALGDITPQLGWGMARALTDNGIYPWLTLDLGFHREYTKQELAVQSGSSAGERITDSRNYFAPALTIGLGGFTFYEADNFNAAVDLEYTGKMTLYDNEFSYLKDGKYTTDKIKGVYNGSSYTEQFKMTNNIVPMLKLGWDSEDKRVGLRSKLSLGVDLDPSNETTMGLNSDNKLIKQGDDKGIFKFGFTPGLELAAQYQIIPEKLTISIGGTINVEALTITTTTTERYIDDKADDHSKTKTTAAGFGNTSTELKAAVAWNLTQNFWLEGSTGIGGNNNNVGLLGNLITFGSILAGLKF
jgi:hypothetical protein